MLRSAGQQPGVDSTAGALRDGRDRIGRDRINIFRGCPGANFHRQYSRISLRNAK
jgi:hypothetical protein